MKKIAKTTAVILNKIDYSETSLIINCYTKDFGKLSAIAKGAKRKNSKLHSDLDLFNIVEMDLYYKPDGLSVLSETNVLNFFPKIKSNIIKLNFAYKVTDLYLNLLILPETNNKLFLYLERFLKALENDEYKNYSLLFIKFLYYFIKEIGYEMQLEICNLCHQKIIDEVYFSYDTGIICKNCVNLNLDYFKFNHELNLLKICINQKEAIVSQKDLDLLINIFEKYLKYHIQDFKGFNKVLE
ncbi:MAG TPA: DNA repair protein RecO [Ignavibacteriales bacterium]|nr:DNA repair protein RecO [Ignavibacteriales bacterium]HPP33451.1 DNA repair protein RecO [Ignavibacteriales bacterium]